MKNCFEKFGFPVDHVYSNHDNGLKLTEDEENEWHSLQRLGVKSEGYKSCDSTLIRHTGVHAVNHMLDQRLTRPEEEPQEEEKVVAEDKVTFFDVLQRL
jgi:hypothetical protein